MWRRTLLDEGYFHGADYSAMWTRRKHLRVPIFAPHYGVRPWGGGAGIGIALGVGSGIEPWYVTSIDQDSETTP